MNSGPASCTKCPRGTSSQQGSNSAMTNCDRECTSWLLVIARMSTTNSQLILTKVCTSKDISFSGCANGYFRTNTGDNVLASCTRCPSNSYGALLVTTESGCTG